MNKALAFTAFLMLNFLLGCASTIKSTVKEEDIFKEAQAIKASKPLEIKTPTAPVPQFAILPDQEELVYKAKFLGIKIGEFVIINKGKAVLDGLPVYHFELLVKTPPFFNKIFKTKDRYVSYMDPQKYVVLRHEEYIKGGTFLESSVDFDYKNRVAIHKNFVGLKEETVPIPEKVLDILSGGFYLRMIPWELGDTIQIKIYADEKIYDYIGLLHSRTKIDLPPLGKQEAYFLKPFLFLDGKQITKISAEVFFSASEPRKPLRAILKTRFGSVHVVLTDAPSQT